MNAKYHITSTPELCTAVSRLDELKLYNMLYELNAKSRVLCFKSCSLADRIALGVACVVRYDDIRKVIRARVENIVGNFFVDKNSLDVYCSHYENTYIFP